MKLIEFISRFPDEESCRQTFKAYRERAGVVCPHCGCTVHYWSGGTSQRYECKQCGYRQSLKANTVLHHSHLTFRQWFIAMHLLTSTKGNLSALEVSRQLSIKNYRTVWRLCNKLRNAMGYDDDQYKLKGEIEIDEAFFKLTPQKDSTHEHLTDVLVMCESAETPPDRKHRSRFRYGHLKMKVIPQITGATIYHTARAHIEQGAVLRSDGTQAHNLFKREYTVRKSISHTTDEVLSSLPWAHISIGHSKNSIKDVYHSVIPDYLQLYLDEFCWKRNHRYEKDLFYSLLRCVTTYRIGWFAIDRKPRKFAAFGGVLDILGSIKS